MIVTEPDASLADVLRGQLGLTGTKVGCNEGHRGSCSVIMDGKLVRSCIVKMKKVPEWACITTVEGIGTPENLDPGEKKYRDHVIVLRYFHRFTFKYRKLCHP